MDIDIKQQVKEYLLKENLTMTDLVNKLNENKPISDQTTLTSLNNKLTRGTIRYSEIIEIAKALDYNIIWEKSYVNDTFVLGSSLLKQRKNNRLKKEHRKIIEKRLSFEISVSYDISLFIDNLIDFIWNTFVIEARIAKIFEASYKNDDFMAINSKLDRYYLPLAYLLNTNSMEHIYDFLTKIKNIYKNGGLEILSDDELKDLLEELTIYNETGFISID